MIYVIGCSARVGSHHLQSLLRSTGVLGNPDEYLNTYCYGNQISQRGWLPHVLGTSGTRNGVVGLKISCANVQDRLLPLISPEVPKYLYLDRGDLDRRAISYYLGEQSGSWHRYRGAPQVPMLPVFDAPAIRRARKMIQRIDREWFQFLSKQKDRTLYLTYADLCADPIAMVERVSEFLGIELPSSVVPISDVVRNAHYDDLVASWVKRL